MQAISNFEMSADLIRRAIEKASRPNGYGPDLGNMFASLADALSDLERYKEAAETYQRALEINPSDARTRYLLGKIFLQLGDRRSAMEQYNILRRIETGAMLTSYAEMLLEEIKK